MDGSVSPASIGTQARVIIAGLAIAVAGAGAYGVYEHNQAKRTEIQNAQFAESLKSTNTQIEQLSAKLNDLSAPKLVVEPPPAAKHVATKKASSKKMVRGSDGRWKEIQSRLDAQGKEIEGTKADLANTRTELTGSIARTHDELVLLERKGEKSYYEFDVLKSKQFKTEGPVGIKLKKANTKKQYADLELIVDDVTLQKKHVNVYEPAVFYSADSDHPVELVINQVTKDRIHGYVSVPKYRRSELTAMSQTTNGSTGDTASATTTAPPKPRQKLQLPN